MKAYLPNIISERINKTRPIRDLRLKTDNSHNCLADLYTQGNSSSTLRNTEDEQKNSFNDNIFYLKGSLDSN